MVRSRKKRRGHVILLVVLGILLSVVVGLGTAAGGYYYLSRDLPPIYSLRSYRPPIITQVFSDDGTLIAEYAVQRRKLTPVEEIPKVVIQAFISTEDKRFFQHQGVDVFSLFRALRRNLRDWGYHEGGSTISMQIARAFFLTYDKKLSRKLREMILAMRIERYISKEEILYLYLNQIDLGRGCYGVAAAAEMYFGKELKNITLAEAAMLAGIAPRPSAYNPVRNFAMAKTKQKLVLSAMVENGVITQEEAEKAYAEPIRIVNKRPPQGEAAPYFTEHVRRLLLQRYGEKMVYQEGLKVFTTVNLKADRVAAEAVRHYILGPGGLDRNLGYRGPVGHLSGNTLERMLEQMEEENQSTAREMPAEAVNSAGALGNGDGVPAPLLPGRTYKAVVEKVDDKAGEIRVLLGRRRGTLTRDDLALAGRPSKPSRLWRPGDLILVKVAEKKNQGGKDSYRFLLDQTPVIQGALFAMSVRTGHVKALSGGLDYRQSQFIRPVQSFRQTGSAFKPIVYAAALDEPEGRYTPISLIVDSPVIFDNNTSVSCPRDEVVACTNYKPRNYGNNYSGAQTLRTGLAKSINTIAVKLCCRICISSVIQYARRLGIHSNLPRLPCLALGCAELSLEELVTAYNVFASGGRLVQPVYITRVYDRDGNLLEYEENLSPQELAREKERRQASLNKKTIKSIHDWVGVTIADGLSALLYAGFPGDGPHPADPDAEAPSSLETPRHFYFDPARPVPLRQVGEPTWEEYLASLREGKRDWLDPYYTPAAGEQVISPQTAFLMNDLMKSVITYGTATAARSLGWPVAGKTGTTNDWRDAWFIGYTLELIAGVWVGPDDYSYSLGKGMSGGKAALPIWVRFMAKMLDGRDVVDFPVPPGIEFANVDLDSGLLASEYSVNTRVEPFKKGTAPRQESPPPFYLTTPASPAGEITIQEMLDE